MKKQIDEKLYVGKGTVGFYRDFIHDQYDKLTGKLLTLIDAVLIGDQNKATKDIIRNIMSDAHCTVSDLSLLKNVEYENIDGENGCYKELTGVFPLTKEQMVADSFFFE